MTSTEERARSIFLAALERPADEWPAFLDETCENNAQVRARAEQLLQAHQLLGSIHAETAVAQATPAERVISEGPGTIIGPYKLLEQIGEGGMGTVFVAQQSEPIKRQVALKIIKPGMDSRQVIARFEAERQALALMDHPNIAKVLDAGTTNSGRPYFVMELVKGMSITQYSDQHHLTPKDRLELFVPVCHAIQHAHQKGIIHRDLKPSNVLVAHHDNHPVPIVIDFGVAKATSQQLTDKTLHTGFGAVVGTFEYMSPEQAGFNELDIDTRSDIYSLGVLLYELLTGSTPFSRKELEKAGMLEMLRVIREEEPSKPSTKLSSSDALPTLSANRGTEPAKLTRLVRGELDWIVMKALDKDRNRRYETANGFAMDIRRYLFDEPVLACPPSAAYRLRKFVRRNKAALAAVGLVLFFLVLLGGGGGWVVRDRAARAVERANHLERAVERAELLQREGKRGEALAVLERAQLLAREAEPASSLAGRIESLQQQLDAEGRDNAFVARFESIRLEDQTAVDVEKNLFSEVEVFPKLREALDQFGIAIGIAAPAEVVARIQQRPTAIQTVIVVALDQCLLKSPSKDSQTQQWILDVLQKADGDPWRSQVRRAWKQPQTLEVLVKDLDVRRQPPSFLSQMVWALPLQSPSRLDLARRVQFAYPGDFWANHDLASNLDWAGWKVAAVRYFTAALALRPDNPGVMLNRGQALTDAGALDAALVDFQRAIAIAPRYTSARCGLGAVLQKRGKIDEAMAAYREALELDPKHPGAHNGLGSLLCDKHKDYDKAIECFRTAIELDPKYIRAYCNLGVALRGQKKLDEAEAWFRKAIVLKPKHAAAHEGVASVLREQGKLVEAIASYEDAIELDPTFAGAHNNLGNALADQGRWDRAIDCYKKAVKFAPREAGYHTNVGGALAHQGKHDEAIDWFRSAVELDPKLALGHFNLGTSLSEEGKLDEAIATLQEAVRLDPDLAVAHDNLASTFCKQKKWDAAIDCSERAIELDPKRATFHARLGNALEGKWKLDDATTCYRMALELDPNSAQAHDRLAWHLATCPNPALRDLPRAVALAKRAVELAPKVANYHNTLGVALKNQKEFGEAVASLHAALELDPTFAAPHFHIGDCLRHFREAIRRDPQHVESHYYLGCILEQKLDWLAAAQSFQQVVQIEPGYRDAKDRLTHSLFNAVASNEKDVFVAAYRDALQILPNEARLHCDMGRVYARFGQWQQAAAAYGRSLELDPSNRSVWYHGIPLWLAAGDVKQYQRHCQQMLMQFEQTKNSVTAEWTAVSCALAPGAVPDIERVGKLADLAVSGPESQWNYGWFARAKGLAELRAGRPGEAIVWLKRFQPVPERGPEDASVFAALAMAHVRLGENENAAQALAQAKSIVTKQMPDPTKGQPFETWHDWLHADILRREAEALFKEKK